MRRSFVDALVRLAEDDHSVVLLTGDLGFTVLEPFAERFPERFFNVGVAEQNMMGLATGLAASGYSPYTYSIATFASMRAYEFLRNGPVLHQLPVRVVGVGGGLDYGHNGPTHYALEDVGIMRLQPGLTGVAPADGPQTASAVFATAALPGPVYLRLGKEEQALPGLDGRFELGRAQCLGGGRDVAIVTYGGVAGEAVAAAALLEEQGVHATVVIAACLAPSPLGDLVAVLSEVPLAVTLEAHYTNGGIGSLVSETVAEHGLDCRVLRCGIPDMPSGHSGDPGYLHDRYLLSARQVADTAVGVLQVGW